MEEDYGLGVEEDSLVPRRREESPTPPEDYSFSDLQEEACPSTTPTHPPNQALNAA